MALDWLKTRLVGNAFREARSLTTALFLCAVTRHLVVDQRMVMRRIIPFFFDNKTCRLVIPWGISRTATTYVVYVLRVRTAATYIFYTYVYEYTSRNVMKIPLLLSTVFPECRPRSPRLPTKCEYAIYFACSFDRVLYGRRTSARTHGSVCRIALEIPRHTL